MLRDRVQGRGWAEPDPDRVTEPRHRDPGPGPSGQGVADRRIHGLPADQRHRARGRGPVGNRRRVTGCQQLKADQPGQQQCGRTRDGFDRCLSRDRARAEPEIWTTAGAPALETTVVAAATAQLSPSELDP